MFPPGNIHHDPIGGGVPGGEHALLSSLGSLGSGYDVLMAGIPAQILGWLAIGATLAACSDTPYREVRLDAAGKASPAAAPEPPVDHRPALRVSVAAMQSPADTFAAYSRFLERMGDRLDERVQFLQRRTYGEVNDLLRSGQLDAALLCTGGYLELAARDPSAVEVVAVPVIDGKTTYHSVVLVPASSKARSVEDLAGMRFAFTDDLSLSGHLYLASWLADRGQDDRRFFGSVTYTHSHDRSLEAVAQGLVDGAAVDSLVYQALLERDPSLSSKVRVIHRSPPFGVMPVVASTALPPERRARLRQVLLHLHEDAEAAAALRAVHFDRFIEPPPRFYDDAIRTLGRPR